MKEMQEMSQESDAIKNGDFNAASFIILGAGIFANVVGYGFSGDKDIVLNVSSLSGDFLKCAVNVTTLHRFVLHLITGYDFVITLHRDLNVAYRAGLFVSGIVPGEMENVFAKPRFCGLISGGDNQDG